MAFWLLSVGHAAPTKFNAVVSEDGKGNYATLQAAIAAAPSNGTTPFTILIKAGTYRGQFIIPYEKRFIHLVGEVPEQTLLTYDRNVQETSPEMDPHFKGTGFVVLADDFTAEGLTFENTSGDHGQALALRVDGDRAIVRHCRLIGWQDTLMLNHGRDYFHDCLITGRVDFIYGSATAVFENCEIRSRNGGHVTAASTPQDRPFGLVFLHCKLTSDPQPWSADGSLKPPAKPAQADLGRPWRPYAQVAFIECELGDHIKGTGWNNWGKTDNEKTARYNEYKNTGPGANASQRVPWSHQLSDAEARHSTIADIFNGPDQWGTYLTQNESEAKK